MQLWMRVNIKDTYHSAVVTATTTTITISASRRGLDCNIITRCVVHGIIFFLRQKVRERIRERERGGGMTSNLRRLRCEKGAGLSAEIVGSREREKRKFRSGVETADFMSSGEVSLKSSDLP